MLKKDHLSALLDGSGDYRELNISIAFDRLPRPWLLRPSLRQVLRILACHNLPSLPCYYSVNPLGVRYPVLKTRIVVSGRFFLCRI
jgi:hypothetical protein